MNRCGLEKVQGQHGHLLVLLVRPGQVALLAVEHHAVGAVPVLHHLEPAPHLWRISSEARYSQMKMVRTARPSSSNAA